MCSYVCYINATASTKVTRGGDVDGNGRDDVLIGSGAQATGADAYIRPLSKLAPAKGFEGGAERRTGVYFRVHEPIRTIARPSEKAWISEDRSGAYFWVREQWTTGNPRFVAGIVDCADRFMRIRAPHRRTNH
jgi:hypothetical protein